jgi:FMN reductase
MVLIVGISGSKRPDSLCLTLVKTLLNACQKHGVETQLIDLSRHELPFFDNRESWDYGPEAEKLADLLDKADGFVIGTPEYHGSLSGTLKNFLDLLDYKKVLAGKPAGFCAVGGGRSRAQTVLDHLMVVARALQLWAVPRVVGMNHPDFQDFQVKDKATLERVESVAHELVRAAKALKK